LLFEIDLDQRVVGVETDLLRVVADVANRVADGALDVQLGVCGHLADHHAKALGDSRLAGDPGFRVLRQHPVEHSVRDLVADLVRMPLGDRLGGEQERRGIAE